MYVTATLEGTVVTAPELRRTTSKGVPVANFALACGATTWVVAAYADLAEWVQARLELRSGAVVTGSLADSGVFTGSDGIERRRIEMRAQSVAPNPAGTEREGLVHLRGTIAHAPHQVSVSGARLVRAWVRTSRHRRGNASDEADVTIWPVLVDHPALAEEALGWGVGTPVAVSGLARPVQDVPEQAPVMPQVQVWARSGGRDLGEILR